jgi:hypothetical protein
VIRAWQAWCYSLSLALAAVLYVGFLLSLGLYMTTGWSIPVLSQRPYPALPDGGNAPLYLAMWTRADAILMLAVLALRTATFPMHARSPMLRLTTPVPALNNILWLLALVATIPCLLIYLVVDAPIAQLMMPQGTLAAAGSAGLGGLAVLSVTLLLYDAAYIANTRERALIDRLGWNRLGQRVAMLAGRLAFYLIHPLLGILFILTWLYDRFKPGLPREEVLA